MKKLIIIYSLILSGFVYAGHTIINGDDIKRLNDKGLKLEVGSKVVLNQHLREQNAEDNSLYSITMVCKHKASKKSDNCSLSELNFRKKSQ